MTEIADKIYQIAIDGPSGAGKSTVAKHIAKELDIDYIDTGAMYRAVAYKMLQNKIEPTDTEKLKVMLENTTVDFSGGETLLDAETVNAVIRSPEVTKMASACSAVPMVREKLVNLQREMGLKKSVIMDGRDIGSNVFKDAIFKYYITATVDERAQRRYRELKLKDEKTRLEDVKKDIEQRDLDDSTRELNPLMKATDAKEVDTTGLGITEVTELILNDIRERLCQL